MSSSHHPARTARRFYEVIQERSRDWLRRQVRSPPRPDAKSAGAKGQKKSPPWNSSWRRSRAAKVNAPGERFDTREIGPRSNRSLRDVYKVKVLPIAEIHRGLTGGLFSGVQRNVIGGTRRNVFLTTR